MTRMNWRAECCWWWRNGERFALLKYIQYVSTFFVYFTNDTYSIVLRLMIERLSWVVRTKAERKYNHLISTGLWRFCQGQNKPLRIDLNKLWTYRHGHYQLQMIPMLFEWSQRLTWFQLWISTKIGDTKNPTPNGIDRDGYPNNHRNPYPKFIPNSKTNFWRQPQSLNHLEVEFRDLHIVTLSPYIHTYIHSFIHTFITRSEAEADSEYVADSSIEQRWDWLCLNPEFMRCSSILPCASGRSTLPIGWILDYCE